MTDMRAILIKDGKGPIENLYIGETATPAVKSGEVLVKVRTAELRATYYAPLTSIMRKSRQITAFSLNRMDISQRKGLYPTPQDASEILGVEFAGHVTALGPDTSATWVIGDQVLGLASGVSQHRSRT
jgi:NADPH:quinone reductase-like Zn-dependent oxidoreductase